MSASLPDYHPTPTRRSIPIRRTPPRLTALSRSTSAACLAARAPSSWPCGGHDQQRAIGALKRATKQTSEDAARTLCQKPEPFSPSSRAGHESGAQGPGPESLFPWLAPLRMYRPPPRLRLGCRGLCHSQRLLRRRQLSLDGIVLVHGDATVAGIRNRKGTRCEGNACGAVGPQRTSCVVLASVFTQDRRGERCFPSVAA
jgi:hypothetical protein